MNRSSIGFTVVLVALAIHVAPAQDTRGLRDQPIPRELVEGLLSLSSGRVTPSIVVSEMPKQLIGTVYVPQGARILGGVYSNLSATVVMIASGAPDSLRAAFRREEPRLGWKEFDGMMGGSSGGFRDVAIVNAGPLMFCNTGTTLTLQIEPVGLSEARVVASSTSNNICAMMQQARTQMAADPSRAARWPVLVNPTSARTSYGTCPIERNYSGGGGPSTELSTAMTPDDLFAHYGRQLADSGWKAGVNPSVTRMWTRTDSLGVQYDFELRIQTFPNAPTCRKISIQTTTHH